ncbi:MAG: peptidylprolyl isomerase [Candidatus Paceibacterota bacterium]
MKNIVLSIIVVFLTGLGIWYFINNEKTNESELKINAIANQEIIATTTSATTDTTTNGKIEEQVISNKEINNKKTMTAILHTSMGDITIKLNPETTPNTVVNFVKLSESNFYDGTKFHRVIKDFMNQAGDPLSKDDSQMARWGTGGPEYQFADEITASNNNSIGSLAMANSGPNTNESQFFINVADNSFLNTKHTVFGQVIDGMDVVMAINNTKTGANDRPVEAVVIKSISIK